MVKGIINAFDHMEFCFVLNLTMGGNLAITWPHLVLNLTIGGNPAVTWPPMIVTTRYTYKVCQFCYYLKYQIANTCYPWKRLISNTEF